MRRHPPSRPVFHAKVGAELKALREARAWSVRQAVIKARSQGHHALTDNSLRWLEAGQTKFPAADVLRAVSALYVLDYRDLARTFVLAEYGVDLLRQPAREGSADTGALADAEPPDVSRLLAVRDARIALLESALEQAEQLAEELVHIAAEARRQGASAVVAKPRRRSRRRTNG